MFSNIHENLPASVVRNVLQSAETSCQDQFSRFFKNAALQNTLGYLYKTPQHGRNAFLVLYLAQEKAIYIALRLIVR